MESSGRQPTNWELYLFDFINRDVLLPNQSVDQLLYKHVKTYVDKKRNLGSDQADDEPATTYLISLKQIWKGMRGRLLVVQTSRCITVFNCSSTKLFPVFDQGGNVINIFQFLMRILRFW